MIRTIFMFKNNFCGCFDNHKDPRSGRYGLNAGGECPCDGGQSRADAEDARAKGCVVYIPARGADTAPAVPTCAGDFPHGSNRDIRRRIGGAGERNCNRLKEKVGPSVNLEE